eukprot:429159-Hanusia_phi.AAC.2
MIPHPGRATGSLRLSGQLNLVIEISVGSDRTVLRYSTVPGRTTVTGVRDTVAPPGVTGGRSVAPDSRTQSGAGPRPIIG